MRNPLSWHKIPSARTLFAMIFTARKALVLPSPWLAGISGHGAA